METWNVHCDTNQNGKIDPGMRLHDGRQPWTAQDDFELNYH